MMGLFQLALTIMGGVAGLAVSIFAIRKLLGWLFPIKIQPSVTMSFDEANNDEMRATITNRSREPIYIVKCSGRSANKLGHILYKHISRPLTRPRLYPCIWFGAQTYPLMGDSPVKLEPGEPTEFSYELTFVLPMFAFHNPMLQVEVTLSNGRKFRSRRLPIPDRWHVSYHIASKHETTKNT